MEPDLAAQAQGEANTPMNGTLEDTTPAGVLQVLSSQRKTGAVQFLGDSGCTVYLHDGELYFAESAETAEDLAVALVRPGRLSGDEWDSCTEAGYPTETVGERLIETGSITRDLLASIVLSVIYDPLIQLFRAPEGDYEFAPDVVHWIGPYRCFSVDAIVSEVRRRTREADEMAPLVPSLDALVRSARTLPETHGSVNLRRDDWEVVVAAALGRTVSELAVELGRGRWSTARLVYRLASADLLMVTPDDSSDRFDEQAPTHERFDSFAPSDGPPPLDVAAFSPGETVTDSDGGGWPMPESGNSAAWDLTEPTADTADSSAWDLTEPATDTADSSAWDLTEPTTDTADSSAWDLGTDDVPSDSGWNIEPPSTENTDDAADANATDDWNVSSLTAVPDVEESPDSPEPPALHPDIAKALAESTYADSATAINAMAARLGAADADDDDDDWDTGAGVADGGDDFWSEGDDGASGSFDFIWKPAVWETGVETAPLPQREHAEQDAESASGAPGSADPGWLDNLYTQFMPGEGDEKRPPGPQASPEGERADHTDPGAAPKQRTLRRLMSAIKRL